MEQGGVGVEVHLRGDVGSWAVVTPILHEWKDNYLSTQTTSLWRGTYEQTSF